MDDPRARLPGDVLRRASTAMTANYAGELSPIELRFGKASPLVLISANPRATRSEVRRLLDIQRTNMAPLVAWREVRELIERAG